MSHSSHPSEMNITLKGETNGGIDPLEFHLLGDAMAAGSGKKKGVSAKSGGIQGRKPQPRSSSVPREEATNLAPVFEQAADLAVTGHPDLAANQPCNEDSNPPSVRYCSKSRGPKKDLASGTSVRKKIGKNKRSLSCNTRPLGVSDFIQAQ